MAGGAAGMTEAANAASTEERSCTSFRRGHSVGNEIKNVFFGCLRLRIAGSTLTLEPFNFQMQGGEGDEEKQQTTDPMDLL